MLYARARLIRALGGRISEVYMTFGPFLFALVLVLIGQVPLVIRLWLDHKERVAPFRKHLYERQVELFQELYSTLTDSFVSLHHSLSIAPPGVPVAPEHQELVTSTKASIGPANKKWSDALKQAELLLPAPLVAATSEYDVAWARMLAVTVGLRVLSETELREEWESLNELYNTIVNLMRLSLGVDALSGQLLSLTVKN